MGDGGVYCYHKAVTVLSWKTLMPALLLVAGACGRVNYDSQEVVEGADAGDSVVSIPTINENLDVPVPPIVTPPDMRLIEDDAGMIAPFYIDVAEIGSASWLVGTEICGGQGKRYCTGEEWEAACAAIGTELQGMDPSSGWEWVAELVGTSGHKRFSCGNPGTHDYNSDPYEIRCCQSL